MAKSRMEFTKNQTEWIILTLLALLLLALFFARLGDHAAEREVQRRKYIDRRHARPEEPEYRQNRRDA